VKGLELVFRVPAGAVVRTDALLFQRVLRNLLSNAVKYTDQGRIALEAEPAGDAWRVAVRDTGPGIPAAEHERVFEEFYQLQNPERDRTKGLGLGLAIVRRLTRLLEVELTLESSPGRGSCFALTVPAAAPQIQEAPRAVAAPAAGGRIDVLVVDDEESIRAGMRTLLEGMGFGVRTAASTEEALSCARTARPTIVLADLRLRRDDDGMRAIRELRQLWPGLPALLISGDTAPERLREAHDAGIPLLHKPVQPATLRDSIVKAAAA
jgi:CheY-like chemotaxis protein/anti-sigma regulatory factor (Ser/Thr protein kinase)